MAKKNKAKKCNPKGLTVEAHKGETKEEAMARASLNPVARASAAATKWPVIGGVDIADLVVVLDKQCKAVKEGDMSNMEVMLAAQAYTLDAMFNRLLIIAKNAEYINNLETYLKMAFKAQAQARATIEAISAVKNPPVARYVNQANIAHGHQQVNNGIEQGNTSRTGEKQNPKNELLEVKDGKRLDTRAQSEAIRDDSEMTPDMMYGISNDLKLAA